MSARYLLQSWPRPLELPVVVQFPINDICDSKCQMCNIWQQKRDREISVAQARTIFSNPLFRHVVALGLNGGEPTLRRDLAELGGMLLETLPRLRTLSLITNGLHAERAIERIGELATTVRAHGGNLDVMVSLDGVGEVHDFVRGVPGNFENAVRVLDFATSLPGVSTRVGCTVIAENVDHLHALLDFCRQRGVYIKYRLGVPNRRLYNLPAPPPHRQIGKRTWLDTHPFALDAGQRWHFAQFLLGLNREYETSLAQVQLYRSLVGQLVSGSPRRAGCDWQHRGVTVSSRGEILYCAVQSDVLGDGLSEDPEALYFRNQDHLRRIIEEKCAGCAHDYVGPPGGRDQLELIADRWLRRAGSSLPAFRRTRSYRTLLGAKRAVAAPVQMEVRRRRLRRDELSAPAGASGQRGTLLCGWYGTETLGDKAILASIVACIRKLDPGGLVQIASLEPMYTRLTVAEIPDLGGCEVIDVPMALRTVAARKALLFAGGPLMAIPQMAEMEALFRRARHANVARILAGCGVGPLGSASGNRAILGVLDAAGQRLFRDAESLEIASRMSKHDDHADAVCEDPAASWVAAQSVPSVEPLVPTLGLGLRDWPSHEYARGMGPVRADAIRANFETSLLSALESLLAEQPTLSIVPIPFCTNDAGGDDRLMYWRLVSRASPNLRAAIDTSLISREPTPGEAIAAMQRCGAFMSMRFHSLVFADTLGLPVVAIDYTMGAGKTHALARKIGCPMLRIDSIQEGELLLALRHALAGRRRHARSSFLFPASFERAWRAAGLQASTPAQQPG